MDEAVLKPVRFAELLAQEQAKGLLVRSALSGRLPHAFLFCGLEGTGRRTAARMLAALLNCQSPEAGDACGRCRSCRKLARGTHPDLLLVEPEAGAKKGSGQGAGEKGGQGGASGRKGLQLTIGQVRELTRRLSFAPAEARVRVSVLWPAGRLNEEASNALLKTLEEPPAGNLLILCCREPGEVLPTIASRCQQVSFAPLPDAVVTGWLLERGCEPELAARLAYLAGGSLTRAERLLEEKGFWEWRERLLEVACSAEPRPHTALLELAAELWPSRRSAEEAKARLDLIGDLLEAVGSGLRDALVLAAAGRADNLLINQDYAAQLTALATCGPEPLLARAAALERARSAIEANCDPQLALEVLLFELAESGHGA